jgi:predicted component of type VI protein secretion system
MKAELIPFDGGPPIPITRDVTVLGRREYCDIQIDDPSLSKRHCLLVKTDGLLVIRDLATTNGTKVKGQKIRWAALLPEDRIAFGSIKFRVYLGPDDVPSPSELVARGMAAPARSGIGFAAPTPIPTPPSRKLNPPAPPRPKSDFDIPPLKLNQADWRDALDSGIEIIEDDEEIIELD